MIVLISVCPVFRSLPAIGVSVLAASATSAGMSALRFGAAFAYGMPSLIAAYAYTMLDGIAVVVRLERRLERLDRGMRRALGQVHLGAAAPHHHQPIEAVIGLEPPDVGDHLVGEVLLVAASLHVRAREPLHVPLIEDRGPRRDRLELGLDLVEQRRLEHAGRARRLIAVLGEDVPPAEHDIVERGEGKHVGDAGRTSVGALAESNRAHLGQ